MTWKLFIDDERNPASYKWIVARSSNGAKFWIVELGLPSEISFDHDLGGEDTSMVFLHWLADYMLENNLAFPQGFCYSVHSQNPVGRDNIISLMNQMIYKFGYEGEK